MENFTETQIQTMIKQLRDEFGPEFATRELALIELEDTRRTHSDLEYAKVILQHQTKNSIGKLKWKTSRKSRSRK